MQNRYERTRRKPSLQSQFQLVTSSWIFHLFFSGLVILIVFIKPPAAFFSGDTDTARNYLNTIVSSLSTILALCISIILVAIQMTASNYTHRVLDFFVRLPYNGSLFVFYLVTIMHSFFLMAQIHDPMPEPLPPKLVPQMSADLVLVVICFISLLVYMYAVIQLLKPERIINLIIRDYNRAFARGHSRAALDNVEQICDIAKRAASVSDSVTGMRCIEAILDIGAYLPLPTDREDVKMELHQNLLDQLVEILGVAVKERETGLLYGVFGALFTQGCYYIEKRSWVVAEAVVKAYRHMVFSHLLTEGQAYYVEGVAERLYGLALSAVQEGERGQAFCIRTWQVVRIIGENVFSTQAPAGSTLTEAFLMPSVFAPSLSGLAQEEYKESGLISYFGLWKAFAQSAFVRDVAEWAAWWEGHVTDVSGKATGQELALLLTVHMGRKELTKTLCHMWRVSSRKVERGTVSECIANDRTLFDGWPIPSLSEILPSEQ